MLGRSANRGAPKAVKETKGLVSQAVTKALQPSFFFAMFEQDVEEFVTGKTPVPSSVVPSGRWISLDLWSLAAQWQEVLPCSAPLQHSIHFL